jgi:succinoglycan biosynthesis transport protein ExoP
MQLADVWRIYSAVVRRRWLMAAVVGSTMAVVGAGCLIMPRYYRAEALVMPSDQALQKPMITGQSSGEGPNDVYDPRVREERLSNFIYLAQSQEVMSRAARSIHLSEAPEQLARLVTVDALPQTAILKITALDKDQDRSVRLANAIAQVFADFYRELTHREAVANSHFLERELTSTKRDLDEAQDRLAAYRSGGAGPGLDPTAIDPAMSPVERDRDSAEADLRATSARLDAARAHLASQNPTQVKEEGTTDNPAVTKLHGDLLDLQSQLAAERAVHTDQHPKVIALQAQIDDLQRRLRTEMERVIKHRTIARNPIYDQIASQVADLETQKASLQARVRAMNELANRARHESSRELSRGVQLAALTRDYRIAEDTYRRLKAAVDQAHVDEKVTNAAGAIQVVDLARMAQGPVTKGPSPGQLLGLGLILSLGLALGLAVTLDFLDDRVKTTDDVMRLLRLPVTGIIPAMEGMRARDLPLITHALPSSPYAEAYRFLRTDLLFTAEDQPLHTLCVVTPKPGQGGTTTIANLAISLAEADRRVILVDTDLRRPSLHRIFGVSNDVGLTSVLTDGVQLDDALQETDIPNLRLLTGGPLAHNPSNLISSNRMRSLVSELRDRSDFVLFDTPSAIAFSDAAIIASFTDGTLMVVRAHQPLRGSQLQVTALLNKARANIVGAVLNDVTPNEVDAYYFHSHYYSSHLPPAPATPAALPAADAEAEQPAVAAIPDDDRPETAAEETPAADPQRKPDSREAEDKSKTSAAEGRVHPRFLSDD